MHHWVKYCVNRCMKFEIIGANKPCDGRTDARTDARTDGRTDGRTDAQHFYVLPNGFAMAGDNKDTK